MVMWVRGEKGGRGWRWRVTRWKSRIACVNQITTVKLISVIRNAPMVARNMYRPIEPIGLNIPTAGPGKGGAFRRRRGPSSRFPQNCYFHAFTKWPCEGKPIERAQ